MTKRLTVLSENLERIADSVPEGKPLCIIKYPNRKMYIRAGENDLPCSLSGYLNMQQAIELSEMVPIKVVSHRTKMDITEDFKLDVKVYKLQRAKKEFNYKIINEVMNEQDN